MKNEKRNAGIYGLSLAISLLIIMPVAAQNFQLSGGVDGRYINSDGDKNEVVLEGLFLNYRKVFRDEKGDRVIAVAQLDMDQNFEKIRPYQTYIQYKGPLGRWNIRVGHYILPFGLLSDYDTERLVLKTLEPLSLGIKLDTGIESFGYIGNYDYAISVSQGVGRSRLIDVDNDKLVTARIGRKTDDLNVGLSVLAGKILTEEDSIIREDIGSSSFYAKRFGFDVTRYLGPLDLRGELIVGEDDNEIVGGGILKADYALTSKLELNLKSAHWQRSGGRNFLGAGFSYEVSKGLFLRVADEYQFGKEDENVATFQTYFEFTKHF